MGLYAIASGYNSAYGHKFDNPTLEELVRFDGVVIRDGVKGGSQGAMHRRWMEGALYDEVIFKSLNYTRWLQMKRTYKLCNNSVAAKKGQPNYNPAYKFDYLFETLCYNCNLFKDVAELDICGDEMSWANGGFGEAGAMLVFRVLGKPKVQRGGQIVFIVDASRPHPRVYIHRHGCHKQPD